jgi:hypothetical protein
MGVNALPENAYCLATQIKTFVWLVILVLARFIRCFIVQVSLAASIMASVVVFGYSTEYVLLYCQQMYILHVRQMIAIMAWTANDVYFIQCYADNPGIFFIGGCDVVELPFVTAALMKQKIFTLKLLLKVYVRSFSAVLLALLVTMVGCFIWLVELLFANCAYLLILIHCVLLRSH